MENNEIKEKSNEQVLFERFKEIHEKLRKDLPELHDTILALSPFTSNKIMVSNAWSKFREMEFWIGNIMNDGYEQIKANQPPLPPKEDKPVSVKKKPKIII